MHSPACSAPGAGKMGVELSKPLESWTFTYWDCLHISSSSCCEQQAVGWAPLGGCFLCPVCFPHPWKQGMATPWGGCNFSPLTPRYTAQHGAAPARPYDWALPAKTPVGKGVILVPSLSWCPIHSALVTLLSGGPGRVYSASLLSLGKFGTA